MIYCRAGWRRVTFLLETAVVRLGEVGYEGISMLRRESFHTANDLGQLPGLMWRGGRLVIVHVLTWLDRVNVGLLRLPFFQLLKLNLSSLCGIHVDTRNCVPFKLLFTVVFL